MNFILEKKKVGFILITGFLVGVIVSIYSSYALAGGGFGLGVPFGGPRVATMYCTCLYGEVPGSAAITIVNYTEVGATPLTLKYIPGVSNLRPFLNIYASRYLLGDYTPGATCMVQLGKICVPSVPPPIGTMSLVGTSQ